MPATSTSQTGAPPSLESDQHSRHPCATARNAASSPWGSWGMPGPRQFGGAPVAAIRPLPADARHRHRGPRQAGAGRIRRPDSGRFGRPPDVPSRPRSRSRPSTQSLSANPLGGWRSCNSPWPRRAAPAPLPTFQPQRASLMARLLSGRLNRVPLDLKEARLSGGARSGKSREERFASLDLLANRG